jgi:hypothetical protein
MKILILIVCVIVCFAQTPLLEPDFADIFSRLDEGKLIPLERQTAVIHGQAHGFIAVSMKSTSELPGSKSPVRFKAGGRMEFVVRSAVSPALVDPNTVYCLRKMASKKKTRELVFMSGHVSPVGMSTNTNLAEGVLPVEFSRYGNSSLKMTVAELAPGEYAVGHVYGPAMFCFGVD